MVINEIILKIAASLFIIFMCLFLFVWCLPEPFNLENYKVKYGKFIYWAGLDNYWSLFAPQPLSKNYLIGFELEFADGTIQSWQLPEYTLKDNYQTAPHFRFIKMHNQLLAQKDPIPQEAICRYVLNDFISHNATAMQPIKIHLIRFYESEQMITLMQIPWLSQRVFTYETNQ